MTIGKMLDNLFDRVWVTVIGGYWLFSVSCGYVMWGIPGALLNIFVPISPLIYLAEHTVN